MGSLRVAFAEKAPREELQPLLESLDAGAVPDSSTIVKATRLRHVYSTTLTGDEEVFVKTYLSVRASDRFTFWPRRSRALQEFENLVRVRHLEIDAVEPLCIAERRRGLRLLEAMLVTRALERPRALAPALARMQGGAADALVARLGRLTRALHDARLWHRDLHRGNVMLVDVHEGPKPVLLDLQKLRALPIPLPATLRARDLAMLAGTDPDEANALISSYVGDSGNAGGLEARVRKAAERRIRRRLRSRERRCVVESTDFRVERSETLRIYRRSEIPLLAVLSAVERARNERARKISVDAPGLEGPGVLEELAGTPWPWPARSQGMQAWRSAHAARLRGFETATPLALIEEREWGRTRRSWLLTRAESTAPYVEPDDAAASARAVARLLASLHESGLAYRRLDPQALRSRPDAPGVAVLTDLHELRVSREVGLAARSSDLRSLAHAMQSSVPGSSREEIALLLAPYRGGGSQADATWRRVFADVSAD